MCEKQQQQQQHNARGEIIRTIHRTEIKRNEI